MIPISRPYIGETEKRAVLEVLESGMLAQGTRTAELEARFAALCGVKHGIATSSGTTALHLALLAHGVGPGDEVITTSFTFIATASSILFTGARPVFVDIEPDTFNMNPAQVEEAITPHSRAILPVSLYGHPCDVDALQAIAEQHGLAFIHDACQAVGAAHKGKPVGSVGTSCFSLYATKNVTSGEGGMITTDDDEIAHWCRLARSHGMERRYYHEMLGYNFRLSDLHAAIGLAQFERLDWFTERRRANAAYLSANLKTVVTPTVRDGYEHVWHQYTVRLDGGRNRDEAARQLNEAGVGTGIFYPVPVHQQGYVCDLLGEVTLPVTEQMSRKVLSLPVHPALSQSDLETIVKEVNQL